MQKLTDIQKLTQADYLKALMAIAKQNPESPLAKQLEAQKTPAKC